MAEPSDSGNAGTGKPPAGDTAQVQVRVAGQYIKDLSFESPNVAKIISSGPGDQPQLRVEVQVNATKAGEKTFESAIQFKAQAVNKAGVIYDLELVYAGLFEVTNLPEQALEPFLLINCPMLLFPFLRRLVADLTREGGYPPLLLDPIDFAGLYMRRQQERAAGGKPQPLVN
jgi:preprotein translocase subunit SecB